MLISGGRLKLVEKTVKEDGKTPLYLYEFIYDEMPCCPVCGAPMHERSNKSGLKGRSFIGMDGVDSKVAMRRLACDNKACYNHDHPKYNLPDILVPHCRYDAEVHQAVADGNTEVPCTPDTIKRMEKRITTQIAQILWALTQMGITLPFNKEDCVDASESPDFWPCLRRAAAAYKRWYLRAVKMTVNRYGSLYPPRRDTS